MDINPKFDEIKEFLDDICTYLKHEIKSLDYQNTCNNFKIAENGGEELLTRCELILKYFQREADEQDDASFEPISVHPECSYLDMSRKKNQPSTPETQLNEYVVINPLPALTATTNDPPIDTEIYDICTIADSSSKSIDDNNDVQNCPYSGLPAAHLAIKKSPKLGQLTRIEKRFIFDQSKKYFCGILSDWLLCYADSQSSLKPMLCVQLSGVDIEHYGEGKRRDLCFQISNPDASKKYIFQSTSEVETKMWIHAIEAAIRGDLQTIAVASESSVASSSSSPIAKPQIKFQSQSLRKLPTPPVQLKFDRNRDQGINNSEDIYEEPCPLYNTDLATIESATAAAVAHDSLTRISPSSIPNKLSEEIIQYDYDVPKRSQPMVPIGNISDDPDGRDLESQSSSPTKIEFQTKIKDVQSQLSNQLLSPTRTSGTVKTSKVTSTSNPTNSPKKRDGKTLVSASSATITTTTPATPVRNWFLNRLNKASAQPPVPQSILKMQKQHSNGIISIPTLVVQNRIVAAQPKGEKVNMIINQLEANGRLPIFKSKNSWRLSSAMDALTDDSNYELINAAGNVQCKH